MSITFSLTALVALVWGAVVSKRMTYYLHMAQLEGYNPTEFQGWKQHHTDYGFNATHRSAFVVGLILCLALIFGQNFTWISIGMMALLLMTWMQPAKEVKKPLVMTGRAKRLRTGWMQLTGFVLLVSGLIGFFVGGLNGLAVGLYVAFFLTNGLCFYSMLVSLILLVPYENKINQGFYDQANEKIKSREDLKVVGITGSFGKTSTKFITGTILNEKWNTLVPPSSFNSAMGVCKVINNDLQPEHQIFICEMGARAMGQIEELAKLAEPQIGVITAIGPTHLETFGHIGNIVKTKYELIENLPCDGIAIFNYDDPNLKKLADKTFKEKVLYGIDSDPASLDLRADAIQVNMKGSTFDLVDKEGNRVACHTKLLGKHNIQNILAGASVAKVLGMTLEEISAGIGKIEPVEHRLQLIDPGTGVLVIDDAFNSNPVSSKAALDVLQAFNTGKRVIVTPGMVELGEEQDVANEKFGEYIADVCQVVVLVGPKQTQPIQKGLANREYPQEQIHIVRTMTEVTALLGQILLPGDVVLFENDLPDSYNE
jgi:UDP-N-acetylmuramoyl-tripeptide--D-alanyl-D-alanine ligase